MSKIAAVTDTLDAAAAVIDLIASIFTDPDRNDLLVHVRNETTHRYRIETYYHHGDPIAGSGTLTLPAAAVGGTGTTWSTGVDSQGAGSNVLLILHPDGGTPHTGTAYGVIFAAPPNKTPYFKYAAARSADARNKEAFWDKVDNGRKQYMQESVTVDLPLLGRGMPSMFGLGMPNLGAALVPGWDGTRPSELPVFSMFMAVTKAGANAYAGFLVIS